MFRRIICVGLLILPGSFFVVGAACLHPRLRKKIVQFVNLSDVLDYIRLRDTVIRLMTVTGTHIACAIAALIASGMLSGPIANAQQAEPSAPVTEGDLTYVSGGVGEDESSAIRAMSQKFNLHMLFALRNGTYLSDVDVVIIAASGARMVALRSNGPMLYVCLEPGRYYISASSEQGALDRWVTVPARGATDVYFYWG